MPALKIPTIFKSSFLSGDGRITVRGDENLLPTLFESNQPFGKEIAHGKGKLLVLDLSVTPAKDIKIGNNDSLALRIQAGTTAAAYLDIIWHDEDLSLLKDYDLEKYINEDSMYLLFRFDGKASLGAKLAQHWGSYGLSGKFGVETGSEVHYAYLRPFRITGHTSRNVLTEYFGNLRLPQNVDTIENIPVPGEVLSLNYGGYLTATAIAGWGYSMNKTTEYEFNKLDIRNKMHIEAKAAICPYYRLAGNFEIQVRRARDDDKNWARVTVKKNRARQFEMPADLTVGVESETTGLPDGPEQFLEALLDIRAPNLIAQIIKFIELTPQQFISAMMERVDGLTGRFVDALSQRWLNKPLDAIASNKEMNEFYNSMMKVKNIYDNLGAIVVGFIEDHIDESGIEDELIKTLQDATNDLKYAMGLQKITNHKVWQFIRTHVHNDWIDLIENKDKAFNKLKAKLIKFKAIKLGALKEFIEVKKQSLNLDELFNELLILNPQEINEHVNRHLKELARRLTGKELDKLSEKELESTIKDAKKQIAHLIKFKDKLYDQFKQALNRSYELSIACCYRHAKQNEALIDVEINLGVAETIIAGEVIPSGTMLMKEALSGDFNNVMKYAAPDRVHILKGLFTHKITRSSQLTINLFGWNYSRMYELITNTEHTIEQKDNGVLHIYGADVQSIEQRKRKGEEVEINLAFNIIARGFQPIGSDLTEVLDSISAMSSCYQLRINDPVTTRQELHEYLQFADYLRLIPDEYAGRVIAVENGENIESSLLRIEGYMKEISEELSNGDGQDFGKVTASYRVQYDAEALMQVFRSAIDLAAHARAALRTITAFTYQQFHPFHKIADIYPEQVMYEYWKSQGLQTNIPGSLEYKIGSLNKKIVLSQHNRLLLEVLYGVEDDFIKSLLKLDQILKAVAAKNRKPKAADLEKILTKFIGFQSKLNKWFGFGGKSVIHPFLAVMNRLIIEATSRNAGTVTLEMIFERKGRTVRKFLVS